jgi:hypothetical protein
MTQFCFLFSEISANLIIAEILNRESIKILGGYKKNYNYNNFWN